MSTKILHNSIQHQSLPLIWIKLNKRTECVSNTHQKLAQRRNMRSELRVVLALEQVAPTEL